MSFLEKFNKDSYNYLISEKTEDIINLRNNSIESYLSDEFIECCLYDNQIQKLNDFILVDSRLTGILLDYSYIFNYFPKYCENSIMVHYPKSIVLGCNFHVIPVILFHSIDIIPIFKDFYSRFYDIKEYENYIIFTNRFFSFKVCKKVFDDIPSAVRSLKADFNQIFIDMSTKLIFCTKKAFLCLKTKKSYLTQNCIHSYAFAVKNYGFELIIPGTYKTFPSDFSVIENDTIPNMYQAEKISAIASLYLNRTITVNSGLNFVSEEQQILQQMVLEQNMSLPLYYEKEYTLNNYFKDEKCFFISEDESYIEDFYYSYFSRISFKHKEFYKFLIDNYDVYISGSAAFSLFLNCEINGTTTIYIDSSSYFLNSSFLKILFLKIVYNIDPISISELEYPEYICERHNISYRDTNLSSLINTLKLFSNEILDKNVLKIIQENKTYVPNIVFPEFNLEFKTNIKTIALKEEIVACKGGFYVENLSFNFNRRYIISKFTAQGVRNKGKIKVLKTTPVQLKACYDNSIYLLNYSFKYCPDKTFKRNKILNELNSDSSVYNFFESLKDTFYKSIFPSKNTLNLRKLLSLSYIEKEILINILKIKKIIINNNNVSNQFYYGSLLSSDDIILFLQNVNFYMNNKYFNENCYFISSKIYIDRSIHESEYIGFYYDINERNKRQYYNLNIDKRFLKIYNEHDVTYKSFVEKPEFYSIEKLRQLVCL